MNTEGLTIVEIKMCISVHCKKYGTQRISCKNLQQIIIGVSTVVYNVIRHDWWTIQIIILSIVNNNIWIS